MSNKKNKSNSKIWQLELANKNMELEISARKQIERSLKDKEDRFRTIFKYAPITYFLCNLAGEFLDGNLAAHQLTGYTNDELFGKNFVDLNLIDKKDVKTITDIIMRSGRGENTGPDELLLTKRDGSKIIIELSTSPVTILEQKQVLGIAHNITDRKLIQVQLKESEERFRKLFDSAHDALMTLNPPIWKFTSGNPAILKMFKVKSVEEFLTYGPWDISPEKQPDGRLSSEKAKEMIGIAMEKGSNFFEWTHKRLNGDSFPARVLLTRIQLRNETFLQATVRDITKQKQAENVNKVLFDISNAVNTTENLGDLYQSIHKTLNNIIDLTNFYIAIVDIKKNSLHFPYHVDTVDDGDFGPITNFNTNNSLTGLVISKQKPILLKSEELEKLAVQKKLWGPKPKIWMGVPLIIKDEVIGVIATQSYLNSNLYNKEDLQILSAVSDQVAIAIDRKRAELELRQSEERFKRLFDDLGDAVYVTRLGGVNRGKILEVNRAAVIQTGYTRHELLKMNIVKDIYISGSGESKGSDWEEKLSQGKVFTTIEKKKKKNGIEFWTEVIVTPIKFKGEKAGLSINHDITKRKQVAEEIEKKSKELKKQFKISEEQRIATLSTLSDLSETTKELQFEIDERKKSEKALKENEEKFRSLTENLPLGIYRNTPGTKGKFIEVNKGLIDMFGFKDRESMLKASVSSLYVSSHTRKIFSDKLIAKGSINSEELRFLRQDGSTFIGSSTAVAVKDKNGKVIHYDGIIEDITERAELGMKLLENEEKFRSIVSNSPCVIMQTDKQGVISFINYKYSGQEPANIIGKTIYNFMPREFHEVARNTIKKVFEKGESYSFENLGFSSDESVVWYKNTVSSIQKNGKVVGVAILAADISEQKQTDIMKTEFISSISHELRTPLTVIRESLALLSDELFGKLNKDQADIVNPCIEDVDKLGRIINNMLDISRMEGQKIKIEREMVDIVKLAQGVVTSFENQAVSNNIKLLFKSNREPINIFIDYDRIIQVFMNLIGNALKFTEEGKIEIIITEKKDIVECCIVDTGRGIDQNSLGTIFDRFHQVGTVMRAGEKSTGLGLSISKGIVKLHKGKIWVNSKINEGSKFCFSLPQYNTDKIIIEHIEKDIYEAEKKHSKLSLLLIRLNNYSDIESKLGVDKANKVTKLIHRLIQDELAPGEFSFLKEKDEVILFSNITKQNITILSSKLKDMLTRSVIKIDKDIIIDLSIGYSIYPSDGDSADKLIKHANKIILMNDKT